MKEEVKVILSFGSNLFNRENYINQAIDSLCKNEDLKLIKKSSLLNNKAILYEAQPDFLNLIAIFQTTLTPTELLNLCQEVEKKLGRIYRFPKGPREIDIDILTYGQEIIETKELTIPHPGIWERNYLQVLLRELDVWEELVKIRKNLTLNRCNS